MGNRQDNPWMLQGQQGWHTQSGVTVSKQSKRQDSIIQLLPDLQICIPIHTYTYTCIYTKTYTQTHTHTHECIHPPTSRHIHAYTYASIQRHTHAYIQAWQYKDMYT